MARTRNVKRDTFLPEAWVIALERATQFFCGALLLVLMLGGLVALASYSASDPSLNHATANAADNLLGSGGAIFADLMLQWFGFAAILLFPLPMLWGWRMVVGDPVLGAWQRDLAAVVLGAILTAGGLGATRLASWSALPAGNGGAFGSIGAAVGESVAAALPPQIPSFTFGLALTLVGLGFFIYGVRFDLRQSTRSGWRSLKTLFRTPAREPRTTARAKPQKARPQRQEPSVQVNAAAAPRTKVTVTRPDPQQQESARAARERQQALALGDSLRLPELDLLQAPPKGHATVIDAAALDQSARLLESVLEDFGVKGEIVEVRPGPVVTMYELEPAPGIKSSRVIGLADDIARSMSALSARVAVVPGRNVIGIELPNARRETVYLRELLGSDSFETQKGALPLVLGKDIAGEPVIADLAPMPHLLIAGTTGSGKSVGLNAMILSLLYRLPPEECRMIMIDPKMLELSVYDGIPHLLSPVVTEPAKAIRALKWAVEQMEDRYRKMASINVRSLSGFNARVREAKAKGKPFVRRVHTGYNPETRDPIYEEERLEFDPMPLIVVVVDELADLMMVAGKDVEILIQRLAQKARAAGIHLIMATQRPSVDVITGVIKANLPTRISFQVTSKIDSRTILGEQGAEQLLGRGDMLYMPGGKQVVRVHGPFVSDEEVERVANHWREQGHPEYVEAVTEEGDGSGDQLGLGLSIDAESGDDALYNQAVQIVADSQKASTSYLQRRMRIGYNTAARLIEEMEERGLVGSPDHVGRRDVFIDKDGNRL